MGRRKLDEKKPKSKKKSIDRKAEFEESDFVIDRKVRRLVKWMREAKTTLVYSGAGISTAANIPDYRGPNGVWTLAQQGKDIVRCGNILSAEPTSSHMILKELYRQKYVSHILSQNCDGLHLRSGLPQTALSEIHGNMNIEVCSNGECERQYIRPFDVTARSKLRSHGTGRFCDLCNYELHDTIVHFGECGRFQWPLNWDGTRPLVPNADLIICVGTSLAVLKAYAELWPAKNSKTKIAIVNLQWTAKDKVAALKIHSKCDNFFQKIADYLDIEAQPYCRDCDPVLYPVRSSKRNDLIRHVADCSCHIRPRRRLSPLLLPDQAECSSDMPGWWAVGLKMQKKEPKPKKSGRRGRPRKYRKETDIQAVHAIIQHLLDELEPLPKRPRGRPRKVKTESEESDDAGDDDDELKLKAEGIGNDEESDGDDDLLQEPTCSRALSPDLGRDLTPDAIARLAFEGRVILTDSSSDESESDSEFRITKQQMGHGSDRQKWLSTRRSSTSSSLLDGLPPKRNKNNGRKRKFPDNDDKRDENYSTEISEEKNCAEIKDELTEVCSEIPTNSMEHEEEVLLSVERLKMFETEETQAYFEVNPGPDEVPLDTPQYFSESEPSSLPHTFQQDLLDYSEKEALPSDQQPAVQENAESWASTSRKLFPPYCLQDQFQSEAALSDTAIVHPRCNFNEGSSVISATNNDVHDATERMPALFDSISNVRAVPEPLKPQINVVKESPTTLDAQMSVREYISSTVSVGEYVTSMLKKSRCAGVGSGKLPLPGFSASSRLASISATTKSAQTTSSRLPSKTRIRPGRIAHSAKESTTRPPPVYVVGKPPSKTSELVNPSLPSSSYLATPQKKDSWNYSDNLNGSMQSSNIADSSASRTVGLPPSISQSLVTAPIIERSTMNGATVLEKLLAAQAGRGLDGSKNSLLALNSLPSMQMTVGDALKMIRGTSKGRRKQTPSLMPDAPKAATNRKVFIPQKPAASTDFAFSTPIPENPVGAGSVEYNVTQSSYAPLQPAPIVSYSAEPQMPLPYDYNAQRMAAPVDAAGVLQRAPDESLDDYLARALPPGVFDSTHDERPPRQSFKQEPTPLESNVFHEMVQLAEEVMVLASRIRSDKDNREHDNAIRK